MQPIYVIGGAILLILAVFALAIAMNPKPFQSIDPEDEDFLDFKDE